MQAQREVFDAEFQHVNGQNGLSKMAHSSRIGRGMIEEIFGHTMHKI